MDDGALLIDGAMSAYDTKVQLGLTESPDGNFDHLPASCCRSSAAYKASANARPGRARVWEWPRSTGGGSARGSCGARFRTNLRKSEPAPELPGDRACGASLRAGGGCDSIRYPVRASACRFFAVHSLLTVILFWTLLTPLTPRAISTARVAAAWVGTNPLS